MTSCLTLHLPRCLGVAAYPLGGSRRQVKHDEPDKLETRYCEWPLQNANSLVGMDQPNFCEVNVSTVGEI